MKQTVRVDDDESDGGMGAAGYVAVLCVVLMSAFIIAALLWLPELYHAAGRGLP
jgi:hypothetical protein